jgi:hypothetical protein
MGGKVRTPTIARAHVGTRPVAYHLRMSVARVRVKRTFETSVTIEMHATGLRTNVKHEITLSMIAATRGAMIIMALTMTRPTDVVLRLEDAMKGGSSLSLVI